MQALSWALSFCGNDLVELSIRKTECKCADGPIYVTDHEPRVRLDLALTKLAFTPCLRTFHGLSFANPYDVPKNGSLAIWVGNHAPAVTKFEIERKSAFVESSDDGLKTGTFIGALILTNPASLLKSSNVVVPT